MKKLWMSFAVVAVVVGGILMPINTNMVYATVDVDGSESDATVSTMEQEGARILNDCWEKAETDGKSGAVCVLRIGVDILTVLVGILGVIGIIVFGIQYLTAGGNESQVTKAKQRLLDIVIGLAIYAVIYAMLNWLLPAFG